MKKTFLACVLGLSLLGSSCLGPNKWFNAVTEWNTKATESKWGNEAIFFFIGSWVAGFAYMGDCLISNSLVFWGSEGDKPVSAK